MRISIGGVSVGHWTDPDARTGCTAVLLPEDTVGSIEVRGGAPASRETDVLHPDKTVQQVDAVLLGGGSAYGLAAADGVMRFLEERERGVLTTAGVVPIVPALTIFDLAVGDPSVRPTAEDGYAAASAATGDVETGQVGAGTGASVGHHRGEGRRPGGITYAEERDGDLVVGALCVVNAFGDVDDGGLDPATSLRPGPFAPATTGRQHTTVGVVVTNAVLTKTECLVIAQGAHDGLSRSISPPHTRFDGDAFVAAATGSVESGVDLVRWLALRAVVTSIRGLAG